MKFVVSFLYACLFAGCQANLHQSLSDPDDSVAAENSSKKFADAERWQDVIKRAISENQPQKESGVAIAIVATDGRFFESYAGYADHERKKPVTSSTLFQIGSTTKAFTAALISNRHVMGYLDISKPINSLRQSYFLDLSKDDVERKITLIDMLSHQSGLAKHDFLWALSPYNRDQLFQKIAYLDFNPKAGMGFRESFQYNNYMYLAAGRFLEDLTGSNWQSLVENEIFAPLGMKSSHGILEENASGYFAQSYFQEDAIDPLDMSSIAPAGSIVSHPRDMAKWMMMLLRNGAGSDGNIVLSEKAVSEMMKPRVTVPATFKTILPIGEDWHYGLGWYIGRSGGERVIAHAGNTTGFSTELLLLPETGIGIFVTSNQSYSGLPLAIVHALQVAIQGVQPPEKMSAQAIPTNRNPGKVALQESTKKPTIYYHPAYGKIALTVPNRVQYFDHVWAMEPDPDVQDAYRIQVTERGLTLPIPMQIHPSGNLNLLFDV